MNESTELTVSKQQFVGLSGLGSLEQVRSKMETSLQIKELIHEKLLSTFKENQDFGPADPRSEKKTLLKPGAEKACHFFNTHPEWKRDDETWEMLGKPVGVICYKCLIVDNASGSIIGEGRGAEKVGNKQRDANKAIKAAEKCAIVDAALYTFMLSDRFTQDDGGLGKGNLNDNKLQLQRHVTDIRAGKKSDLSDNQFIIKVCNNEIHKKSINTQAELDIVWEAIDLGKYELETGDRFPE
jgi:hypothetical protein